MLVVMVFLVNLIQKVVEVAVPLQLEQMEYLDKMLVVVTEQLTLFQVHQLLMLVVAVLVDVVDLDRVEDLADQEVAEQEVQALQEMDRMVLQIPVLVEVVLEQILQEVRLEQVEPAVLEF